MSTQLVPFQFEDQAIRVVVIDDQPLFSARDVALALGYARPADAYQDHCKLLKKLSFGDLTKLNWANPNPQGEYVMPESDVYRLIVKSAKPEAERFERWVFEEVLPSIRKTGGYTLPKAQPSHTLADALKLSKEAARVARAFGFDRNMIALSANNLAKTVTGIDVLQHMGATHLIANPKGQTYTPTELGKMLSPPVSAAKLNLLLEASGLQTKEFGHWLPTDKADGLFEWLDTGKRHSDGTPVKQVKWFQDVLTQLPQIKQEAA